MEKIKLGDYVISTTCPFDQLPDKPTIVNTINAYSWIMADRDDAFRNALQTGDYLLPDGIAVVWAARFLKRKKIVKIAGADLHAMLLKTLSKTNGRCFYLGASNQTLDLIRERLRKEYPSIAIETYSPPFKPHFTAADNQEMLDRINAFAPDVLFVGMTAPKQEKWIYQNRAKIKAPVTCAIGAVFDFYSGSKQRPPQWMINLGLEWFGRLLSDPMRLWKRYIVYNPVFIWKIIKIKCTRT